MSSVAKRLLATYDPVMSINDLNSFCLLNTLFRVDYQSVVAPMNLGQIFSLGVSK